MFEICRNCGKRIWCFGGICKDCIESIKQTIQKVKDETKKGIWEDWMKGV